MLSISFLLHLLALPKHHLQRGRREHEALLGILDAVESLLRRELDIKREEQPRDRAAEALQGQRAADAGVGSDEERRPRVALEDELGALGPALGDKGVGVDESCCT